MLKIINKLFNYFLEWYMAIIIFLILIVIWQLLSNFKLIEPWLLPSPIDPRKSYIVQWMTWLQLRLFKYQSDCITSKSILFQFSKVKCIFDMRKIIFFFLEKEM